MPQVLRLPVFELKTPPKNHDPKLFSCLIRPAAIPWGRGVGMRLLVAPEQSWPESCGHRTTGGTAQLHSPLFPNLFYLY